MAKLLVYLEDERHADLKELAHRHKTTMADLVRYALEETFEDQLDVIAGERGLEEYLNDPSSAISLDDYLKERGIVLPDSLATEGVEESRQVSRKRQEANPRSRKRTTREPVS